MDRMLCRIHCGLKGNEPVLHDFKAREDTLREREQRRASMHSTRAGSDRVLQRFL